jgi:undecaprenyl phosphate-alpha-L-ara4FN deformylase
MIIALKIDVDTLDGTLLGVPALVTALQRHRADATFLFSLGPDHTGRAIKRVFRPGFLGKVKRTSVTAHYGYRTLLYGTLLPGPDIGKRGRDVMRMVAAEGFETGIHTWDHVKWQDGVVNADAAWTERQMLQAVARYVDIFGVAPRTHGAAGWQMNRHALRLTERLGFQYASDSRGSHPFLPVVQAEIIRCPQLPTTLPTLDELIGVDGIDEHSVANHILRITERDRRDHVFTLHAELEGRKLAPTFDALLAGWQQQGYELVRLQAAHTRSLASPLPLHEVALGSVPGRSGTLLVQGKRFLD